MVKGIFASATEKMQSDTMYDFENVAKASDYFDKDGTGLSGKMEKAEDSPAVFSFPIKLKLKRPIQLQL